MEDTTSDIFIRNDPEASIFFRDAYPTGDPVASLEGFPFSEFDVELSVPLIAKQFLGIIALRKLNFSGVRSYRYFIYWTSSATSFRPNVQ